MSGLSFSGSGLGGLDEDRVKAAGKCRAATNAGDPNNFWCHELDRLNELAEDAPPDIYGPAVVDAGPTDYDPSLPPTDEPVVYKAVQQANLKASQSLSAHAQAAAIRAQQLAARNSMINTGAIPRPMPESQQVRVILSAQKPSADTGAKIALSVMGILGIVGLGILLFKR